MRKVFLSVSSAALVILSVGCREKVDANSQLEKAARELDARPAAQLQPTPQPGSPTPPGDSTQPPAAPAQEMNQAMIAYKAGNLEDAVTRLQRLRATPAMTPQQRIALNDAIGAVMTEVYSLAAKGDSRAQMAVKQYEKMQTGGR
ncbi:MAG TPA: hypothetical protein VFZ59_04430 [Verrucomicrobiae bacterium]|nr:hypothetical protein [Verrucomicrobiae bacterium]